MESPGPQWGWGGHLVFSRNPKEPAGVNKGKNNWRGQKGHKRPDYEGPCIVGRTFGFYSNRDG